MITTDNTCKQGMTMILQLSSQIGDVKVSTKAYEVNVLDYCSPRSYRTRMTGRFLHPTMAL